MALNKNIVVLALILFTLGSLDIVEAEARIELSNPSDFIGSVSTNDGIKEYTKWYSGSVNAEFYCVDDGGVPCYDMGYKVGGYLSGESMYCGSFYNDCYDSDLNHNFNGEDYTEVVLTCPDGETCEWDVEYWENPWEYERQTSTDDLDFRYISIDNRVPYVQVQGNPLNAGEIRICGGYNDHGGSGESKYGWSGNKVLFSGPGSQQTGGWVSKCDTFLGFEPNTEYCGFTADARDLVGNINRSSNSVCVWTLAETPANPVILDKGHNYIRIVPSRDDENPDHTRYKISVGNSEDSFSKIVTKNELYDSDGVKIEGLKENTVYGARIRAIQEANKYHTRDGNGGSISAYKISPEVASFRTLYKQPTNINITASTELKTLKETREKIPSCGNTICEEHKGENENSCPSDCRPDVGPCNQDGVCDSLSGETSLSCPSDCGIDGSDLPDPSEVEPGEIEPYANETIGKIDPGSKLEYSEFVSGDDYVDVIFKPSLEYSGVDIRKSVFLQTPDGGTVVVVLRGDEPGQNVIVPLRYYFDGRIVKHGIEDLDNEYGIEGTCFDFSDSVRTNDFEIEVYGDIQGAAADGDWVIKKHQEKFTYNDLLRNSFIGLNIQGKTYTNEDDCQGNDDSDYNPITIWDWKNDQEKTNLESYIKEKKISASGVSPQIILPTQYYKPDGSSEYRNNYIRGWISRNNPITITFPDLSTMTITCRESYCPDEERKYFSLSLPFESDQEIFHPDLEIDGTIIDKPLDGTMIIGHEETENHEGDPPELYGRNIGPGNAIELNIRDKTFASTTVANCEIEENIEEDAQGQNKVTYSGTRSSLWNWHETEEGSDYCEYSQPGIGNVGLYESSEPTDPEVSPENYKFYLLYSVGEGVRNALLSYFETTAEGVIGGTGLMTKISEKILPFYSWVENSFLR